MNLLLWPYLALTSLGYGLVVPGAALLRSGNGARRDLGQRLGRYGRLPAGPGGPRVWMQAVSVGEVHLAAGLLKELKARRPELDLILSTSTTTGRAEARRLAGRAARVIYFPWDTYPGAVRAVSRIAPDLLVLVETELWPAIISRVLGSGARAVIVNGRISDGSDRGYRLLAPLFRPLLARFHGVGAVGPRDAERLINLGARPERVAVTGNAKQDSLGFRADEEQVRSLGRTLGLSGRPVWVAGSIRAGEEETVVSAFQMVRREVPEAVLVAAPRHPERNGVLAAMLKKAGLEYHLRSELNGTPPKPRPVIILDTMGELLAAYGSAWVALVGGGLAPKGGQNPLEPAYWSKPVIMGPHMEHFAEPAERLLAAGGAVTVQGAEELSRRVIEFLTDQALRDNTGRNAGAVCRRRSGAFERSVELILNALDLKG